MKRAVKRTAAESKKGKQPVMLEVLRYLSIFSSMFVLFPPLVATETYFYGGYHEPVILLRFAALAACGFFGFLVSFLLSRMKQKLSIPEIVINLFCFALCLVPSLFSVFVCGVDFGSLRTPAMILYAVIAYMMGTIYYYRPYAKINTKTTLAWMCGLHIGCMMLVALAALGFVKEPITENVFGNAGRAFFMDEGALLRIDEFGLQYDFTLFIPEFLIFIIIFGMVRNQSHIDFLMARRKHKMEDLPKWVRSYNLGLMSAILAVIAVLFLCRDWIIVGIKWLAKWISIGLYRLFYWVGSWFVPDQFEPIHFEENAELAEEIVEEAARSNPYGAIFSYVLVALLLVGVIWLLWRFHVFGKLWSILKKSGSALMRRLQHGADKEVQEQDTAEEFTDEETELSKDLRSSRRGAKQTSAFKEWRQRYKRFLKVKEQNARYREGYLLLRQYLKLRGVAFLDGDTVLQLHDKAVKSKKVEAGKSEQIAWGYNLLEYAERGCGAQSMTALEETLRRAYDDSKGLKTVERV